MSIEAMKLALEALEELRLYPETPEYFKRSKAITSLRQAIREHALREVQRLGQEIEQEPVAWRGYNWGHSPDDWVYRDFDDPILDGNGNNVGQPLYTTPPQRQSEQEPVALPPIYFMRDNHTFKILSNDVSTALIEIEQEFNEGWTYGSLCSKRKGFAMIHASGDKTRLKFFAECKAALEAAHGITGENNGTR